MRLWTRGTVLLLCIATMPVALGAQTSEHTPWQRLGREIFGQLIEINTTDANGSNTAAAEAMATRLLAAGFPPNDIFVAGPHPTKGNLVVRYRGSGEREPLLLLAHLDVVEALPADWSVDPFTFQEMDGYFYGRGTTDDKDMAAIWITNLIRYKREGFRPNRDLIVALTADEEGGPHNGVAWLIATHRDLIDAEYAINEGGSGLLKNGRPLVNEIQTSEKVYLSFALTTRNPGGHSSRPRKDNAINRLASALTRLAQYQFPPQMNETTKAFFERMATIEGGEAGQAMLGVTGIPPAPEAVAYLEVSPYYNALMRTTCIATMLQAGHAENALPQTASAVVNCRILPEHDPAAVHQTLARVIADTGIVVTPMGTPTPSPPSPLIPEIMRAAERVTNQIWPGTPVVPVMLTGATDGLYLRNARIPTYGISGLFHEVDDVRAHGRDERIGVQAFYDELEFLYRLVKDLSSTAPGADNHDR